MADDIEYRITIDVPNGNGKGVRYQAHAETMVTGVRWVITGDLAKALRMWAGGKLIAYGEEAPAGDGK